MAHAVVPTRVYVQSSLTNGEMKISVTSLIIASCFICYTQCEQEETDQRGIFSSTLPVLLSMGIFFTGTKWCGAGNIASNYTDLGTNYETDVCCRDHDYCTDIMPAGTCKYGICNDSSFTRSLCECDDQFRSCLMNSTETASTLVGMIFFNYAAIDCYQEVTPTVECLAPTEDNREEMTNSLEVGHSDEDWCFVAPFPFERGLLTWVYGNETTESSTESAEVTY